MPNIRLDKLLADCGYGTRSQVKALIKKGKVAVDHKIVTKSEIKINTDINSVNVDGVGVNYCEYEYFMLNKPAGVVSATKDSQKTVIDLITQNKRRDLFPVGRLDKDTEGLLIITNDGHFANNLLAPGKHVDKIYYAKIMGEVTEETIAKFKEGVDIGDETPTAPAKLCLKACGLVNENYESEIEIVITEGRYHQIKRMFKAVGMEVVYLKRLAMGTVFLDETLELGNYRPLTKEEICALKK